MRFQHITAPVGSRTSDVLPTDNSRPDRFVLIETIRKASTALGLKAPVIGTLDALLSCLPPKRNHDFVFASNATLAFKRNGISDRTIRRHIAQLAEAGLLTRSDSPNRKRFTKNDMSTGKVLRFGFDLTLLFESFEDICAMADTCTKQASHIAYLRTKLRCAIVLSQNLGVSGADVENAQRALRRKLTASTLQSLLDTLITVEEHKATEASGITLETDKMTVTDGQNDRHHHSSKKELLDSDIADKAKPRHSRSQPVTIGALVDACEEAATYLQHPPERASDVISHARSLAPMMGIDSTTYRAAENRLGELETAITIWGILQLHKKIRQIGAYFRAITLGERSASFDPWAMINRLIRQKALKIC